MGGLIPVLKEASIQDPRRTAQTLIADHTITLDELWIQWWANGGWASEAELCVYLTAPQWSDSSDLKVLAWALEDLELEGP